jgi:hypothetical protein
VAQLFSFDFAGSCGAREWSAVFMLGEEKSNEVMEQLKVFMKAVEGKEDARRGKVHFNK